MMKNHTEAAAAAILLFMLSGAAGLADAEEIFQLAPRSEVVVNCGLSHDDVGCTRFQGYIYVGRSGQSDPSSRLIDSTAAHAAPSKQSEKRLYLHIGASETP